MIGRLAKYFGGALPILVMMDMKPREIKEWWDIYIYQVAEDDVISEKARKDKPIPSGKALEKLVESKIKKWRSEGE
jgi:hypothetical protein